MKIEDVLREEIIIHNEAETAELGIKLGQSVEAGKVIALIGDLGTGKTTLTKSIAKGLGITDVITSPTFNIVKEYRSGRIPLYHFDVYRLGDPDEMFE
ncbi:MAG: tRNA (adenosine(37)-N6)-threonylcarbamoyltransferase complex ATPase subunit type 1 TsaE, partial [Bacillota bacterium]|nr:tRNA (adenosine(37)-N6)-threonylcarbamoyltransferase complex ATPase subunit type 1 TsaE [Bacillota bacterium]